MLFEMCRKFDGRGPALGCVTCAKCNGLATARHSVEGIRAALSGPQQIGDICFELDDV